MHHYHRNKSHQNCWKLCKNLSGEPFMLSCWGKANFTWSKAPREERHRDKRQRWKERGVWSAFRLSLVHSTGAFQRPFTLCFQIEFIFTGWAKPRHTWERKVELQTDRHPPHHFNFQIQFKCFLSTFATSPADERQELNGQMWGKVAAQVAQVAHQHQPDSRKVAAGSSDVNLASHWNPSPHKPKCNQINGNLTNRIVQFANKTTHLIWHNFNPFE